MPIPFAAIAANPIAQSLASSVLSSVFSKTKKPSFQDQISGQRYSALAQTKGSIQGAVQAAKENGLHPLAALGMPTHSGNISHNFQGNIPGQNIGRAISAGVEGYREKQLFDLQVERATLENDILKSQLTNVNQQPGDPPRVEPQPSKPILPASPQDPSRQGDQITKNQYVRTDENTLSFVPSKEMKERMEDDVIQQLKYHGSESFPFSKTRIKRYFKAPPYPHEIQPPKGKKWRWNPSKNQWKAK